jgi:type IV secretion system protein VirB10
METAAAPIDERDIRPVVGKAVSNRDAWLFGGMAVVAAVALFTILEARRASVVARATMAPSAARGDMISAPPPLSIPDLASGQSDYSGAFRATVIPPSPSVPRASLPIVPRPPRAVSRPAQSDADLPTVPATAYMPPYVPPAPTPITAPPDNPPVEGQLSGNRVGATRLANPSTTVPHGAVIQAVLETALDSNRPGFARAIVSRDVRSFDGTRILIPRGSRLFGEYKADLAEGQNRAFIQWETLTRPDGVQIAVNSPAADPLGRAGVKGDVDTKFLERFAGSILQSTLDIGVGIASRRASGGTVVIGLPGSSQTTISQAPQSVKPTLKVPHGSTVSVFVARDLDFIAVD